jgi:hypothetical protein
MRKEVGQVGPEERASVREEVKGSVGHGSLLFKLLVMARALKSSSLFSRILISSSEVAGRKKIAATKPDLT